MIGFLDLPSGIRNKIYFHTESLLPRLADESFDPKISDNKSDELGSWFERGRRWYSRTVHPTIPVDGGNFICNGKIKGAYRPAKPKNIDKEPGGFPVEPNITKANRQIRQETLPIFYGNNKFSIIGCYWPYCDEPTLSFRSKLIEWLHSIEPQVVKLIPGLEICCYHGCGDTPRQVIYAILRENLGFTVETLSGKWDRDGSFVFGYEDDSVSEVDYHFAECPLFDNDFSLGDHHTLRKEGLTEDFEVSRPESLFTPDEPQSQRHLPYEVWW